VTARSKQLIVAAVLAAMTAPFAGVRTARAEGASECVKGFEAGAAAREHGKLRDARKHFVTCAVETCPKTLRIDCARLIDDVDASLPTVVFGAKDAHDGDLFDVSVLVDGERVVGHEQGKAVPLDPGPHVVRFERPGSKPVEERVLLRAGEHNRSIIAKFVGAPSEPPEKKPPAKEEGGVPTSAIVFGALGLAAVGSFTLFGVLGAQEKDRLRGSCAPGCSDDEVSALKGRYIAADISLGVGIVALGLAAYFLISSDGGGQPQGRLARTIWK
jgi:hypothetical protein